MPQWSWRFEWSIRELERRAAQRPPGPAPILFVGSSSIRFWDLNALFPDLVTLNHGFGGSELVDALYYADRIVIAQRPRAIVLYSGDNDLAHGKSVDRVVNDFRRFVAYVHQHLPDCPIVILSIKPSPLRWHHWASMQATNLQLVEICRSDPRLEYVDLATPLLGADGRPNGMCYQFDRLHLNDRGYRLWTHELEPTLQQFAP